ncbi:MAG: prepilin-type N-terminal cleavage/methylation domain-containing protein [Proteobacteria bacterium]|nr:prepilin-type N-terminal cleavage/methylation domain-containing protein [Pseudomonadota bacterium]
MLKKNKGFSLVELMIGLAMLSILAGLFAPYGKQWYKGYSLTNGVNLIKSAVQLAKMTSTKNGISVVVQFTQGVKDNGTYCVFVDDGGGIPANAENGTWQDGEQVFRRGTMPNRIEIYLAEFDSVVGTNDNIMSTMFGPMGLPVGGAGGAPVYYSGQVYVCHEEDLLAGGKGNFKRINIGPSGTIRIERSDSPQTEAAGGYWHE